MRFFPWHSYDFLAGVGDSAPRHAWNDVNYLPCFLFCCWSNPNTLSQDQLFLISCRWCSKLLLSHSQPLANLLWRNLVTYLMARSYIPGGLSFRLCSFFHPDYFSPGCIASIFIDWIIEHEIICWFLDINILFWSVTQPLQKVFNFYLLHDNKRLFYFHALMLCILLQQPVTTGKKGESGRKFPCSGQNKFPATKVCDSMYAYTSIKDQSSATCTSYQF